MHCSLCAEVNDTSIWMPKLNDFGNESRFSDDEKNVFVGPTELWTLWLLISTSTLEAHSRVYLLIDDIQRRSGKDEFPFQASALSWESTCYSWVRVQFSDLSFRWTDCPFWSWFSILNELSFLINVESILKRTQTHVYTIIQLIFPFRFFEYFRFFMKYNEFEVCC